MADSVSTLGLQLINISNLTSGQTYLSTLNQQLASGKKSAFLSDYNASDAQRLLNFSNNLTQRNSFIDVAKTIQPRIGVYDSSLTGIEKVAGQMSTIATSSASYNADTNGSLSEQIKSYMQQISYYMNQKVGDRYIFSGTRYGTAPVGDITALAAPVSGDVAAIPGIVSGQTLPAYDSEYDPLLPSTVNAASYVQDQVSIDTTQNLRYGISSNQTGFQQLIMGLRYAYAATQDPPNYTTNMDTARTLISQGLDGIRGIHSNLSAASTTLETTQKTHTDMLTTLNAQIQDIQGVDINEVAVKINTYQSQLQASYAATAQMTQLSILKYL